MNTKRIRRNTIMFKNSPKIIGNYSVVGEKEGNGPLSVFFHEILHNDLFGESSYEKAERKILQHSIYKAIEKANLTTKQIDAIVAGDLMNQIISSSFAARAFDIPFLGLYGACSTMAESLIIGSCLIDGMYCENVACATGSHFSSVEKQFRYPLELGNQRPPFAQWTVTGAGCSVLSLKGRGPVVKSATFGKVTDYGIVDPNNMGAAMAPAACQTIIHHLEDTNKKLDDFDLIVTGDLGKLGSEILRDLMEHNGHKLGQNYCDCGQMIFSNTQRTFQGGSGAGCSATVFNSFIMKKLRSGEINNCLFIATGALLSPLSSQQGDSIPGIAHAVYLEKEVE